METNDNKRYEDQSLYHVRLSSCLMNFSELLQQNQNGKKIIYFDECTQQLILLFPEQGKLTRFTYSAGSRNGPTVLNKREITFSVQNKVVTSAKFSLDDKYVAFQSNPSAVEFIHLKDSSLNFVQMCRKSSGSFPGGTRNLILGFFWTFTDDLFFVTSNGIELYQFPPTSSSYLSSKKKELKLIKEHKVQVNWFHYSAKHRMLIISTGLTTIQPNGASATTLQAFRFTPGSVVKVPKFAIEKQQPQTSGNYNKIPAPLKQEEITVASIYNKLYCIHVDSLNSVIVLYQITKEAVNRKYTIPIHIRGNSFVQIVDNLLIIHNADSKVAMICDIQDKDCEDFPFAAPLPMSPFFPPSSVNDTNGSVSAADLYAPSWVSISPNFILDAERGYLWDVSINLESITMSCTDKKKIVQFLMRRTVDEPKALLLRALRMAVQDQESLAALAEIFDIINSVLATAHHQLGSNTSEKRVSGWGALVGTSSNNNNSSPSIMGSNEDDDWDHLTGGSTPSSLAQSLLLGSAEASPDIEATNLPKPLSMRLNASPRMGSAPHHMNRTGEGVLVVTQAELYTVVFSPIEEGGLDYKFMVGVITEYIRSLNYNHISVEPFLYELLINYLVRNNRFYQLHQLLQYHVVSDSVHVACQLLSLENTYPPAYQLALDMLKRLHTHAEILEVLLTKKQLIAALRFIRTHKSFKYSVPRVLEVASTTNDNTLFFTVYKFFEQRREITAECATYVRLFKQTFEGTPANIYNK